MDRRSFRIDESIDLMAQIVSDTLSSVVERITQVIKPSKIILFGSRARGTETEQSDFDICILLETVGNKREIKKKLYGAVFGLGVSVDFILEENSYFNANKDNKFLIYYQIVREGKIIYE